MGVYRVMPNRECIAVHSLIEMNKKEEQRIRVLSCNNTTSYRSKNEVDTKVQPNIQKNMKNELIHKNHCKGQESEVDILCAT